MTYFIIYLFICMMYLVPSAFSIQPELITKYIENQDNIVVFRLLFNLQLRNLTYRIVLYFVHMLFQNLYSNFIFFTIRNTVPCILEGNTKRSTLACYIKRIWQVN